MSIEPQPFMSFKQVVITALIAVIGFGGYQVKNYLDQQTVEQWVKDQPVIQMVLEKHPKVYARFIDHFSGPYKSAGEEGLRQAQIEIQQIINVNYMTDYIWQFKDKPLLTYLRAQYALVVALLKNQKAVQAKLCERYFADSSLFSEVDEAAGRDVFLAYMGASEALFLSAKDGVSWPVTPSDSLYRAKVAVSVLDVLKTYRGFFPKESRANLYYEFDPTQSCARFAGYLYAMLSVKNPVFTSLAWRGVMENSRPKFEELRRQRGSD